jgi:nitroreductase
MNEYNNLLNLINKRQSCRAYASTSVEHEKILHCIEAARIAPSACNAQPWKFIVVDDPEMKNQLADLTTTSTVPMNHFTKQAPVIIAVIMESGNFSSKIGAIIRDKPFTLIDIGIASIQFCLQAIEEGLGTCMIGWFNEKKVKQLLKIPKSKRAVLLITVGYPLSDEIRTKRRKEINEIYSMNNY